MSNKNNFAFWMPIEFEKGKNKNGEDVMKLKGIASTKDRDSDGEILLPEGFELDYFLKKGYLNWHHGAKVNPKAIIGEPTSAKITKEGLYIEAELYKSSELAKDVHELAQILSSDSKTRRLGFSIEGKALERDPFDNTKITKARITGCAVTHMPKNPASIVEIMKGDVDGLDMDFEIVEDKIFNKGEVYSKIFFDLSGISTENAVEIYNIINKTSEIMSKGKITQEAIDKAYESLGIEKANMNNPSTESHNSANANGGEITYYKEMEKGEYKKMMKDEDGDEKEADDKIYVKKGDEYVVKTATEDVSKGEKTYFKKSEAGDYYRKVVKDEDGLEKAFNDDIYIKKDDKFFKKRKNVEKADENNIEKAITSFNSIIEKSEQKNSEMFKAVGDILKDIKEGQESFQKGIQEQIEDLKSQPVTTRKSYSNANALEKGGFGVEGARKPAYSLKGNRKEILSILNDETFSKGEVNDFYANALVVYESSGVMDDKVRTLIAANKGIKITD